MHSRVGHNCHPIGSLGWRWTTASANQELERAGHPFQERPFQVIQTPVCGRTCVLSHRAENLALRGCQDSLYKPPQGRKWLVRIKARPFGRWLPWLQCLRCVRMCVSPMLGPSAVPRGRALEADVGVRLTALLAESQMLLC